MTKFHFNIGGNENGVLGMAGEVTATSREDAVNAIREFFDGRDGTIKLAENIECDTDQEALEIGYINLYVNSALIGEDDIDDAEPVGTVRFEFGPENLPAEVKGDGYDRIGFMEKFLQEHGVVFAQECEALFQTMVKEAIAEDDNA